MNYTDMEAINRFLETERTKYTVYAPSCPREIEKIDIPSLVARLQTECAQIIEPSDETFKVIFNIDNDDTALVSRAIQEDQILKTKLKLKQRGGRVINLPSFWDVWFRPDRRLQKEILGAEDPNEAKWESQRKFSYKIATTFMPGYAKAIMEYFGAKVVLDPCAGWGDRLIGALASNCVEKYVGFDPNLALRPGYAQLVHAFGHTCTQLSEKEMRFSNGSEIRNQPFEVGAIQIENNTFDLVFTSPPFFDYEMYCDENPMYSNWIDEFYKPLMIHSYRCVKPGGKVVIYVGDTSAGAIDTFMRHTVMQITALKFLYMIGFNGIKSNKVRGIWVYEKPNII